jgi:hypothetical protein
MSRTELRPVSERDEEQSDPEQPASEEDRAVAFVWVPTRPFRRSTGSIPVQLELRRFPDGVPGLAVFTEKKILVEQLGDSQPHVKISILTVLEQISRTRVPVLVNPTLHDGAGKWTDSDVKAWRG